MSEYNIDIADMQCWVFHGSVQLVQFQKIST